MDLNLASPDKQVLVPLVINMQHWSVAQRGPD